ncbi:unnamed protein product [Phytophthora lilii]|uniref:Unnamed protein product n=1 Tax=Phytophthora lilii TaxID=2077276 RepID=A0A9W6XF33_9STRA|nr:unnamed protein product [Phytophthora lilii]
MPWGNQICYVHNIYAANTAAERRALFEKLPRSFEDSAVHIVCGDFNLALDPDLDAGAEHPNPDPSRRALALWLAQLNVTEPWRLHHPADKVYSGPLPRVNRLDYIFLSDETVTDFYLDSGYSVWENGGDHLAHHVELSSWHHPTGTEF